MLAASAGGGTRGSTAAQVASGGAPLSPRAPRVSGGIAAGAFACQPLGPSRHPVDARAAEHAGASAGHGQRETPDVLSCARAQRGCICTLTMHCQAQEGFDRS